MSNPTPERKSVAIFRRLPKAVMADLENRYNVIAPAGDGPLQGAGLDEALQKADALLPTAADPVDAAMIDRMGGQVKIIANFGVGHNNINSRAARARNIAVTNTPDVLTDCTADIAVMLILMAARRATKSEQILRDGAWGGFFPTFNLGRQVAGKSLGIIGMGRIGKAVAKRCHFGFDMPVYFYNRSPMDPEEALGVGATQLDSIEEVLAKSDFVSLNCPGGAANRHLINAERLACMKPSAYLINTARGDVVDELALIAALQAGTIAGAGLDVFEQEPSVPEALMQMDNVTLLPHIGSGTEETRTKMGQIAVSNIDAFFALEALPNLVN